MNHRYSDSEHGGLLLDDVDVDHHRQGVFNNQGFPRLEAAQQQDISVPVHFKLDSDEMHSGVDFGMPQDNSNEFEPEGVQTGPLDMSFGHDTPQPFGNQFFTEDFYAYAEFQLAQVEVGPKFDLGDWRHKNPVAAYHVDIIESLWFLSSADRHGLLRFFTINGPPVRLSSIEGITNCISKSTASLWSTSDLNTLIYVRDVCKLAYPIIANRFFLGRLADECMFQYQNVKGMSPETMDRDIANEFDYRHDQAEFLSNLNLQDLLPPDSYLTRITGPQIRQLYNEHWLENHRTAIIESLQGKSGPLPLENKLRIRDVIQANGWPIRFESYSHFTDLDGIGYAKPWLEQDTKALIAITEAASNDLSIVQRFFPGRSLIGLNDKYRKATHNHPRSNTHALPEGTPGLTSGSSSRDSTPAPRPTIAGIGAIEGMKKRKALVLDDHDSRTLFHPLGTTDNADSDGTAPAAKKVKYTSSPWTFDQERVLYDGRQAGRDWTTLSAEIGRPESACKSKWSRIHVAGPVAKAPKKATPKASNKEGPPKKRGRKSAVKLEPEPEPESELDADGDVDDDAADASPDVVNNDSQDWTRKELHLLCVLKALHKSYLHLSNVLTGRSKDSLKKKWRTLTQADREFWEAWKDPDISAAAEEEVPNKKKEDR
ncbi:hypothetical protein K504DRAFT_487407 [Pleomassaria siparia CBS 279.74]|uniref:Myb-like domain-containing protein n=1 Tax=Pleomassaria siparia CBS 279.74 TaxID=1314801 RepID=A0A6G1KIV6_9PLEO|nr:hypothetical protein K504DRAFT_487407 [Pleomassaria siparia CBS 279.74]